MNSPAPTRTKPGNANASSEGTTRGVGAPRILIVDDDELIRTVLVRIARRDGYRVAEAENARRAIAEIERDAPDLVLCDIYMPEADGFELINWLREEGRVIPTIAMSGTVGILQDHLSLAGKLGAVAILSKPFDPYDVSTAIAAALSASLVANGEDSLD